MRASRPSPRSAAIGLGIGLLVGLALYGAASAAHFGNASRHETDPALVVKFYLTAFSVPAIISCLWIAMRLQRVMERWTGKSDPLDAASAAGLKAGLASGIVTGFAGTLIACAGMHMTDTAKSTGAAAAVALIDGMACGVAGIVIGALAARSVKTAVATEPPRRARPRRK